MESARKPLRLWPGVVIVILLVLLRFGVPVVAPEAMAVGFMGSLACAAAVWLWWLFLSRAPWRERLGAVAVMAVAMFATKLVVDKSIATGGMGFLFFILVVPNLAVAFVVWAVATRRLSGRTRRVTMVATILVMCGFWALVRTGGFTANFHNDLHWRWSPTPEERLVAQSAEEPAKLPPAAPAVPAPVVPAPVETPVAAPAAKEAAAERVAPEPPETAAVWPGFRGPHGDGVISGVRIKTDWTASPPAAVWRRPIGPGWSSFAVRGDLIFTQEQRGPDEVVACYKLSSGEPVWVHRDKARFWESNGGPGPRGTPTLYRGRVYTFGATGVVNALNARDGSVVWSHNVAADTEKKTPEWGFASSPLVLDELVIVAASGRLAAYDRATGARRWMGPSKGTSYSSPRLLTIGGVRQVLLLSSTGATSVALADGKVLWEHTWKGYPIVQPGITPDGDILLSVSDSSGLRRLGVTQGAGGWTVEERWTSNGLKPYFNDFVIHNGYAYGFDGSILSCIDLKDGKRKWKGGRYGNGQMILLADQDLLLLTAEEGELALVGATPDGYKELARAPGIEGKTWNHPVLAGNVLLVRNGEQMAAFRLAPADGSSEPPSGASGGAQE